MAEGAGRLKEDTMGAGAALGTASVGDGDENPCSEMGGVNREA